MVEFFVIAGLLFFVVRLALRLVSGLVGAFPTLAGLALLFFVLRAVYGA